MSTLKYNVRDTGYAVTKHVRYSGQYVLYSKTGAKLSKTTVYAGNENEVKLRLIMAFYLEEQNKKSAKKLIETLYENKGCSAKEYNTFLDVLNG